MSSQNLTLPQEKKSPQSTSAKSRSPKLCFNLTIKDFISSTLVLEMSKQAREWRMRWNERGEYHLNSPPSSFLRHCQEGPLVLDLTLEILLWLSSGTTPLYGARHPWTQGNMPTWRLTPLSRPCSR